MLKALNDDGMGFLVQQLHRIEETADAGKTEQKLTEVLGEFEDVFEMPQGLPPIRE